MKFKCGDCEYGNLPISEEPCDSCSNDGKHIKNKHELTMTMTKDVVSFDDLLELESDLYHLKNEKYGNSFDISVEKYGFISALTRMSDKWNRIENLILTKDNGTEDESLIDSLMDLANYANMTILLILNKGVDDNGNGN